MKVYDYYITPAEYELAAQNGVSRELVNHRIRGLGWDKDRAVITSPRKTTIHRKWLEIAAKNGISKRLYFKRVYRGWSKQEAATKPVMSTKEIIKNLDNYRIKLFEPEDIQEAARNGISYETFRKRVRDCGWTVEEAKTRPLYTPTERASKGARAVRRKHGNIFAHVYQKKLSGRN
ncbi:hypothetical protein [Paenibacillus lactis]|uniref:Uncharacterized protein n=1 Tax=Paenibacillus lactis TaxID=228574 RepID=A0ABS4F9X6_9BACL|nr:hypothetical protein [Paenibacillus lactis]MBP1893013.1 hypothetical protein [Paenibacillus lactis]HAF97519.1 hypothetical protein [Paenibacillus lactis]